MQNRIEPTSLTESRSLAWVFDGKTDYLLFSDWKGGKCLPIRSMRQVLLALISLALDERPKPPFEAEMTNLKFPRDFQDACDRRVLFSIDDDGMQSCPERIRERVIAITGQDCLGAILAGRSDMVPAQ
jgi:hypothetical protein